MATGAEQHFFAFTLGLAELKDDGFLLRADGKKPESKNTTNNPAITTLTMPKLLCKAAANACAPLSSGVGGCGD